MKLVTPPLIVKENDSFKNDVLDRKDYGKALCNIIDQTNEELVISIDGKWGEGKTTFVKMWQGMLTEANITYIYIDAFAIDYVDDAFISIVSKITEYADTNIIKECREKINEFTEKAVKVGGELLSWSVKMGVKAATLGIIKSSDLNELGEIKNDLAKDTSGLVSDFISERIKEHSKNVEIIQSFKILLSEIPLKLENSKGKPIVIIIDELDRCKPVFAVEILEKVKHLFSVKNIVFVLVMNMEQLEESIKCVYGQNIDAHTYLQKFINIETSIPKRINDKYNNDLDKYSKQLIKLHEFENVADIGTIYNCIYVFAIHFNLSLRQLEKVFTNLAFFYSATNENSLRIPPIIAFLSVIKVIKPKIFDKLYYKKITYEEVNNELKITTLENNQEMADKTNFVLNWLRFTLYTDEELNISKDSEDLKNYYIAFSRYSIDRREIIPYCAKILKMMTTN